MSQFFSNAGQVHPGHLNRGSVLAGITPTSKPPAAKTGYTPWQVGFGENSRRNSQPASSGAPWPISGSELLRHLTRIPPSTQFEGLELGEPITVERFEAVRRSMFPVVTPSPRLQWLSRNATGAFTAAPLTTVQEPPPARLDRLPAHAGPGLSRQRMGPAAYGGKQITRGVWTILRWTPSAIAGGEGFGFRASPGALLTFRPALRVGRRDANLRDGNHDSMRRSRLARQGSWLKLSLDLKVAKEIVRRRTASTAAVGAAILAKPDRARPAPLTPRRGAGRLAQALQAKKERVALARVPSPTPLRPGGGR